MCLDLLPENPSFVSHSQYKKTRMSRGSNGEEDRDRQRGRKTGRQEREDHTYTNRERERERERVRGKKGGR